MIDDGAQWLADLKSPDADRRVRALHAACPCTGSFRRFEQYGPVLRALKKDPSPAVGRLAIHLEHDAMELMQIDDERAGGFRRNRPGGWGRRGEPRRASIRHGR